MTSAPVAPTNAKLARTACDRCRIHKMRCNRDPDLEQCRRCLRAGETCQTGPARKAGRPRRLFQEDGTSILQTPPTSESSTAATPASFGIGLGQSHDGPRMRTPESVDDQNSLSSTRINSGTSASTSDHACSGGTDRVAIIAKRTECMKKLGQLHLDLHVDVDLLRGSRLAQFCNGTNHDSATDPQPSWFIGRHFERANSFLEIVDCYDFDVDVSDQHSGKLAIDTPTLLSLMSCYINIVRLFRCLMGTCLYSLPHILSSSDQSTLPQLIDEISIGGFKLTGRIDLQIRMLVQITEDILQNMEAKFGLTKGPDQRSSTAMLRVLLDQEAKEQPGFDLPRGHCESLGVVLEKLKQQLAHR